jgi:hypothetical protein
MVEAVCHHGKFVGVAHVGEPVMSFSAVLKKMGTR